MKGFRMVEGKQLPASEWAREGKPEWRHHLMWEMSRHDALRCIEQLSRMLRLTDERVTHWIAGELEPMEDGETMLPATVLPPSVLDVLRATIVFVLNQSDENAAQLDRLIEALPAEVHRAIKGTDGD